jgi:hypothetical protein
MTNTASFFIETGFPKIIRRTPARQPNFCERLKFTLFRKKPIIEHYYRLSVVCLDDISRVMINDIFKVPYTSDPIWRVMAVDKSNNTLVIESLSPTLKDPDTVKWDVHVGGIRFFASTYAG